MAAMKGQHVIGEPPPTMPDPPPPLPRGKSHSTIEIDVDASSISIVRPGDTLVIAFSGQLDQADAILFRERLERELPGVQAVIIGGASALAVYRPEAT